VGWLENNLGSLLQKLRNGSEAGLLGQPAGARPRCSWAVSAAGPEWLPLAFSISKCFSKLVSELNLRIRYKMV
jgi:hypothetical protein